MQDQSYRPADNEGKSLELTHKDKARRLVLQKAVVDLATKLKREAQADFHDTLEDGESMAVMDTLGRKLGTITRSFPKPKAIVVDKEVVLKATPEEHLEYVLPDSAMPEVMALVLEHMPELLEMKPTEDYLERTANLVVARWEKTGEEEKGWKVRRPEGTTSVRLDKNDVAAGIAEEALLGVQEQAAITEGGAR